MKNLSSTTNSKEKILPPEGLIIFGISSLIALISTAYRYLTPLSGVNGTPGALLALCSELIICIACIFLITKNKKQKLKGLVCFVSILCALTFIAEIFLHGWISTVALAISFISLLIYAKKDV